MGETPPEPTRPRPSGYAAVASPFLPAASRGATWRRRVAGRMNSSIGKEKYIEPHFLFPLFQFLPTNLQTCRFSTLPWAGVQEYPTVKQLCMKSLEFVSWVGPNSLSHFRRQPLLKKRFCGLVKSFVACTVKPTIASRPNEQP